MHVKSPTLCLAHNRCSMTGTFQIFPEAATTRRARAPQGQLLSPPSAPGKVDQRPDPASIPHPSVVRAHCLRGTGHRGNRVWRGAQV